MLKAWALAGSEHYVLKNDSGGDVEHKVMVLTLRSRGAKTNYSQIK